MKYSELTKEELLAEIEDLKILQRRVLEAEEKNEILDHIEMKVFLKSVVTHISCLSSYLPREQA